MAIPISLSEEAWAAADYLVMGAFGPGIDDV
jgi:hypothetical protein